MDDEADEVDASDIEQFSISQKWPSKMRQRNYRDITNK
jgi:hypothetical protein